MDIERLPPIATEEEYRRMLAEAKMLARGDPGIDSPEGQRLISLAVAIETWESAHTPIREARND